MVCLRKVSESGWHRAGISGGQASSCMTAPYHPTSLQSTERTCFLLSRRRSDGRRGFRVWVYQFRVRVLSTEVRRTGIMSDQTQNSARKLRSGFGCRRRWVGTTSRGTTPDKPGSASTPRTARARRARFTEPHTESHASRPAWVYPHFTAGSASSIR